MYFLAVVLTILFLGQGRSSSDRSVQDACHIRANSACQSHAYDNMTYCGSDGIKYHGLCSLLLATCDHHFSVTGYGESCTQPTAHPHTTQPAHTASLLDFALYNHLIHGIDDRLTASRTKGVPPSVAKLIFSTQDDANASYVRNKDCWTHDLDLSPISPWNSESGNRKPGTLVSPRHFLAAPHFSSSVNSTIRFVDLNNHVAERVVVNTTTIAGPNIRGLMTQDIVVGVLDTDVPNTISFAKVMPQNQTSFRIPYNFHLPVLSTDLEEKALVDDVYFYSSTTAGLLIPPQGSIRHDFYEPKTSGNSGNPSFLILDNELVLWLVFDSVGGGSTVSQYIDQINGIMIRQGGGYRLSEVDVSKFVKHNPHIIG